MLLSTPASDDAPEAEPESQAAQEAPAELKEVENETAIPGGVAIKAPSAVANLNIIFGKNGSLYLCASTDMKLEPRTHLGGLGGGQFQAHSDRTENVITYEFPQGARSLVLEHVDEMQVACRA